MDQNSRILQFRSELLGPPEMSPATAAVFRGAFKLVKGAGEVVYGDFMARAMLQHIADSATPFGVSMVAWSQPRHSEVIVDMALKLQGMLPEPGYEVKGEFVSWKFWDGAVFALFASGFCVGTDGEGTDHYSELSPLVNLGRSLAIVKNFSQVIDASSHFDPWVAFVAIGAVTGPLADNKRSEVMTLLGGQ